MRDSASHIIATAGLAAATLLAALGWQLGEYWPHERASAERLQYVRNEPKETRISGEKNTAWRDELMRLGLIASSTALSATSSDPLSAFGNAVAEEFAHRYFSLKESGTYSPEKGAELGAALGANIRTPSDYSLHGVDELVLDTDTSMTRVLEYRSDMRDALAMLITQDPPEFETYALYVETQNPERLRELEQAQRRYQSAETSALAVVVPQDAAELHIRAVNALGSYAHTLEQLIRYSSSPFTSLAILRTYNEAEREMLYAFDALSGYYVRKSTEK
ncbi:hypothetical protein HY969_00605 [Candidatus Kaiserbacteria bacterium]|nr:hypothetical protein [Candidatus Kaiserbacteria bacterium]